MTGFEYRPEDFDAAKLRLDVDFDQLTARTLMGLRMLEDGQSERKWGSEDGALRYRDQFLRNVATIRSEVDILRARAQAFVDALNDCIRALKQDEEDASSAQQALQDRLISFDRQTESNQTRSGYSRNTGTEADDSEGG